MNQPGTNDITTPAEEAVNPSVETATPPARTASRRARPAAAQPAAQPAPQPAARPAARLRLLQMAQRYHAEGAVRQAMEIYWQLLEDHDGTEEARHAEEHIVAIAEAYERDGARHIAKSIYERLL